MECTDESCSKPASVLGMCQPHYANEWRRRKAAERAAALPALVCGYCGVEYRPEVRTGRNQFCSRTCKEKRRIADGRSSLSTRKWLMFNKYGITFDQYQELLAAQAGGCAICGTTEYVGRRSRRTDETTWLHVDHDHATGHVRGLLCMECNTGLGKFKDDPALLRAAAEYLST